jgi:hypothetical protein
MNKEEREGLGKPSTRINSSGSHLARVTECIQIDGSRFKITVEAIDGGIGDITVFYSSKDPAKEDTAKRRALSLLKRFTRACGTSLEEMQVGAKTTTVEYSTGSKPAIVYPKLVGKELNIITHREISLDDKNNVYVKQVIDTSKFFSKDGRNDIQIVNNTEADGSLEAASEEAKAKVTIDYRDSNNPIAKAKLAELTGRAAPQQAAIDEEDRI